MILVMQYFSKEMLLKHEQYPFFPSKEPVLLQQESACSIPGCKAKGVSMTSSWLPSEVKI